MPHVEQVPIRLKKSSVPGKVPLVTDLEYGELALNYNDGMLRFKTADNEIAAFPQAKKTLTPAWSSTMTIDLLAGRVNLVRVTLDGPTTFIFTNVVDDQRFILELTQGVGGNKTYTFPATIRIAPALERSYAPSTTAGLMDMIGFIYHVNVYDLVAHSFGIPTS